MHRPVRFLVLSAVLIFCLGPPGAALAEDKKSGGDLGTVSIWDVSGVTGDSESYANQLSLVMAPSLKLGRLRKWHPRVDPIRLQLELSVSAELSGNDGSFRGAHYSSPALLPGGAEAIAINEVGSVSGASTGQVEGTGRRALLSDLWLGISQPALYRVPWIGLDLGARLSFTFPTSASSRASGLIMALGSGVTLSRTLFSRLELSYSLRYVQYLYRYTTSEVETLSAEPVKINGRVEPLYTPHRGTVLNPSFGVINELAASVRVIKGLSVSASYSLTHSFTYALDSVSLDGQPLADPCADGQAVADAVGGAVVGCGERTQRDTHWFRLDLSYQVLPALSVTLGLNTLQPVRHEGGGISNPFVQTIPTANYTTVELGLQADLERTVDAVRSLVRRAPSTKNNDSKPRQQKRP